MLENLGKQNETSEPAKSSRVHESVRDAPGKRMSQFTVEERRRLADFFVLLDSMDRAHAAPRERKAA